MNETESRILRLPIQPAGEQRHVFMRVPYPLTTDQWLHLHRMLEAMRPGLVFDTSEMCGALGCHDCGLPYGGPGWCDTHVPSDVWARISPTGDEGGVLCLTCMARRVDALGLDRVPLMVTSGPWSHEPAASYQEGWAKGYEVCQSEHAAALAPAVVVPGGASQEETP